MLSNHINKAYKNFFLIKMTLKHVIFVLIALFFVVMLSLSIWSNIHSAYAANQVKKIEFKEFWVFFSKSDISLKVKIADTNARKMQGLMGIHSLSNHQGMLFLFDKEDKHCFWMKNTYIPLSIAFLDNQKNIVDIQNMQPLDNNLHCPNQKIRYALEVNQGWFDKKGLEVGDRVHF